MSNYRVYVNQLIRSYIETTACNETEATHNIELELFQVDDVIQMRTLNIEVTAVELVAESIEAPQTELFKTSFKEVQNV